MALFEKGGDRGRYLLTAYYDHFSTITPTSLEPESIFVGRFLLQEDYV